MVNKFSFFTIQPVRFAYDDDEDSEYEEELVESLKGKPSIPLGLPLLLVNNKKLIIGSILLPEIKLCEIRHIPAYLILSLQDTLYGKNETTIQTLKGFREYFEELLSFIMQYEKELQTEFQNENNLPNSIPLNHDRGVATQVHQIVWHSATTKFAYPIAYYGNTLTAHEINQILFNL
ncbi:5694_t:CDS:2 [Diversispora eburnea]|uniref:5694_t:CDS:1 n=1 Tax=Diversispora eburnea TaxID=1213867 RepID=A0A9N8UVG9_9GLOM|nr:5694_t:CDS:2 [Diversispora eburnea]